MLIWGVCSDEIAPSRSFSLFEAIHLASISAYFRELSLDGMFDQEKVIQALFYGKRYSLVPAFQVQIS